MRNLLGLATALLLAACMGTSSPVRADTYDERSTGGRAFYTGMAVVANVMPVVSAMYAPTCLPGYVVCKVSFAFASVVVAAGQVFLSGGDDWEQTQAILHRGFGGDWYLTGRHTAGDAKPQPLPDPPAPSTREEWTPPPL